MSKKFREWTVDQVYLFPPRVSEFVPAGHVAHFVRDFVRDELDLRKITKAYDREGAPAFHPAMMTALVMYGYCHGVRSSRKLSQACEERVDFMAVTGMQKPNFRTICLFRTRHRVALEGLFGQVLELCSEAGLVKLGHVALDGTKIKANAAKDRGLQYIKIVKESKKIKEEIKKWFDEAEELDAQEDEQFGKDLRGDELPEWAIDKNERRKRLEAARKELEAKHEESEEKREKQEDAGKKPPSHKSAEDRGIEKKRYNFTDPDSVLMKTSEGIQQAYNAQCAVDASSQVIVACAITNEGNDYDQLMPMLKLVEKNVGRKPKEVSADAGYCSETNLADLERYGVRGYIAPQNQLPGDLSGRSRKQIKPGTLAWKMEQRLRKAGKRSRYRLRGQTVEPVFGIIKAVRGLRQFLLRGIKKVGLEWRLMCTVNNLLKLKAARTA